VTDAPTATDRLPFVSLIVPAFNEAENVQGLVHLFAEIVASHPDLRFEAVLVDDGSTDGTSARLEEALRAAGTPAQVLRLSRNFGSHAAITAGFRAARGDCAMTLSADLQEPMSVIRDFVGAWQRGAGVVWGVRSTRSDPHGLAHAMSEAFSRWFHRWSTIPTYPAEGPSIVLVSRAVLDVVNAMDENNRNVFGLVAWAGFSQVSIGFDQLPRPAGKSKWTNAKKIKLVIDSFVGFSQILSRVAGYVGAVLCALSALVLVGGVLVAALPATGAGWWFVSALVMLVGGLNLGFLSVMGEYVWRAGDDARRRPVYVLESVRVLEGAEHPATYSSEPTQRPATAPIPVRVTGAAD
jgi:dolichol-phosphate mannosyltransferase